MSDPISPSALRGAVDLSGLANRPQRPPASGGSAPVPGMPSDPQQPVVVPSLVIDADEQTFQTVVDLSSIVPVIVALRSDRIPQTVEASRLLGSAVRALEGRMLLALVEIEANPRLAQLFQQQQLPEVTAFVAGQSVPLFSGVPPEEQLAPLLQQLLQVAQQSGVSGSVTVDPDAVSTEPAEPPLPPLHQEAYDAIERGDLAAAASAYEKAIKQNPADRDAEAGLAQVRLLQRLSGVTPAEVRQAAADKPQDAQAQLAVADLDLSGGHVDDAFDRLLTLFPSLEPAEKAAVRTRILEYFEIVGVDDPRVVAARRRLASLLF